MRFTHLHVHTEWSLLDGMLRIEKAVDKAKGLGMEALAITDHGSMYGVLEFYKKALAVGIHPILGCEIYLARGSRLDKTKGPKDDPYHLVLLAENDQGYGNLIKIVSQGFLDGFYYKPRVDMEVLSRFSKGLLALTACVEGEVPSLLAKGETRKAESALKRYLDIFGKGQVYLEIQRNGVPGQDELNRSLVELSQRTDVPLVATNDCHYLTKEDAKYHEILLAIQTGTNINDPKRLTFPSQEFYLKSPREMEELFREIPQSLENTWAIAQRCNAKIDLKSVHLPSFPLPKDVRASDLLRKKALEGLLTRFKGNPGRNFGHDHGVIFSSEKNSEEDLGEFCHAVQDRTLFDAGSSYDENASTSLPDGEDKPIFQRLDYELSMIEKMGYSSYFLIVEDFVSYAKNRGIKVGPGRGSAAGSLVAYALGITDVDPIKHDLVFERFLNPERVTMPDIDIDFQDDRRDEVIDYVRRKYGEDKVCQIITFGTLAARAAIRDVGRAMALPYKDVDRVAKLVPSQPGMTLEKALEISPELKDMTEKPEIRDLLNTALRIEGMPRHSSIHAAGVVITPGPLVDYVPLARTQEGAVVTQLPMENLEELGLLKMDFLGLRTLTVIKRAEDLVTEKLGRQFRIEEISLDNEDTYSMLQKGESVGVFQLESSWVRDFLKEMKPKEFKDLIASVALCRPGPMEQIPEFIRARFGEPHYLHPILEPVLSETHGVLVYQEQILKIASVVAGFTLGEADILRRAVGKKKKDLLLKMEAKFLEGAQSRRISLSLAKEIYDLILKFANYGFNKNHAAPYALLAYQTAYLKCRYPLEFMAALLSSVAGSQGKVGVYLEEAKRMGISVLGPSVQKSQREFSVEGRSIRYGLSGIKNIGDSLGQAIIDERNKKGEFRSLDDLAERLGGRHLTKKALESLIKCGACDQLGTRRQNLEMMDQSLNAAAKQPEAQESLFGLAQPLAGPVSSDQKGDGKQGNMDTEVPLDVRLSWEKELLGMYFSGHPLEGYKASLKDSVASIQAIYDVKDGQRVSVIGIVSQVKKVVTRSGEEMAFISIEDEFDTQEVIVFPKVWYDAKPILSRGKVVIIKGNVEEQEEVRRILASDVLDAQSYLSHLKM